MVLSDLEKSITRDSGNSGNNSTSKLRQIDGTDPGCPILWVTRKSLLIAYKGICDYYEIVLKKKPKEVVVISVSTTLGSVQVIPEVIRISPETWHFARRLSVIAKNTSTDAGHVVELCHYLTSAEPEFNAMFFRLKIYTVERDGGGLVSFGENSKGQCGRMPLENLSSSNLPSSTIRRKEKEDPKTTKTRRAERQEEERKREERNQKKKEAEERKAEEAKAEPPKQATPATGKLAITDATVASPTAAGAPPSLAKAITDATDKSPSVPMRQLKLTAAQKGAQRDGIQIKITKTEQKDSALKDETERLQQELEMLASPRGKKGMVLLDKERDEDDPFKLMRRQVPKDGNDTAKEDAKMMVKNREPGKLRSVDNAPKGRLIGKLAATFGGVQTKEVEDRLQDGERSTSKDSPGSPSSPKGKGTFQGRKTVDMANILTSSLAVEKFQSGIVDKAGKTTAKTTGTNDVKSDGGGKHVQTKGLRIITDDGKIDGKSKHEYYKDMVNTQLFSSENDAKKKAQEEVQRILEADARERTRKMRESKEKELEEAREKREKEMEARAKEREKQRQERKETAEARKKELDEMKKKERMAKKTISTEMVYSLGPEILKMRNTKCTSMSYSAKEYNPNKANRQQFEEKEIEKNRACITDLNLIQTAGNIPQGVGIAQVATGRFHSLICCTSGKVYSCGDNSHGAAGRQEDSLLTMLGIGGHSRDKNDDPFKKKFDGLSDTNTNRSTDIGGRPRPERPLKQKAVGLRRNMGMTKMQRSMKRAGTQQQNIMKFGVGVPGAVGAAAAAGGVSAANTALKKTQMSTTSSPNTNVGTFVTQMDPSSGGPAVGAGGVGVAEGASLGAGAIGGATGAGAGDAMNQFIGAAGSTLIGDDLLGQSMAVGGLPDTKCAGKELSQDIVGVEDGPMSPKSGIPRPNIAAIKTEGTVSPSRKSVAIGESPTSTSNRKRKSFTSARSTSHKSIVRKSIGLIMAQGTDLTESVEIGLLEAIGGGPKKIHKKKPADDKDKRKKKKKDNSRDTDSSSGSSDDSFLNKDLGILTDQKSVDYNKSKKNSNDKVMKDDSMLPDEDNNPLGFEDCITPGMPGEDDRTLQKSNKDNGRRKKSETTIRKQRTFDSPKIKQSSSNEFRKSKKPGRTKSDGDFSAKDNSTKDDSSISTTHGTRGGQEISLLRSIRTQVFNYGYTEKENKGRNPYQYVKSRFLVVIPGRYKYTKRRLQRRRKGDANSITNSSSSTMSSRSPKSFGFATAADQKKSELQGVKTSETKIQSTMKPLPIGLLRSLDQLSIVEVACGGFHSLVLDSNGKMYFFGDLRGNSFQQSSTLIEPIIRKKTIFQHIVRTPTLVKMNYPVVHIACGENSCACVSMIVVRSSGKNSSKNGDITTMVGTTSVKNNRSLNDSNSTTQEHGFSSESGFNLGGGMMTTRNAIKEKEYLREALFTWGIGSTGILGHNNFENIWQPKPVDFDFSLETGQDTVVYYDDTSNNNTDHHSSNSNSSNFRREGKKRKKSAQIYYNSNGIGDSTSSTSILQVSCGKYHLAVLSKRGLVFCQGLSDDGRLGIGSLTGKDATGCFPQRVKEVPAMDLISNINHRKRNKDDHGSSESSNVLHSGPQTSTKITSQSDHLKGDLPISRTVACGGAHSAVVDKDLSVWTWGSNRYGQLGLCESSSTRHSLEVYFPRKVFFLEGKGVCGISCGERHTCAITLYGLVYSWGGHDSWQLGVVQSNNGRDFESLPRVIEGLMNRAVVQVSCSTTGAHTMCIVGHEIINLGSYAANASSTYNNQKNAVLNASKDITALLNANSGANGNGGNAIKDSKTGPSKPQITLHNVKNSTSAYQEQAYHMYQWFLEWKKDILAKDEKRRHTCNSSFIDFKPVEGIEVGVGDPSVIGGTTSNPFAGTGTTMMGGPFQSMSKSAFENGAGGMASVGGMASGRIGGTIIGMHASGRNGTISSTGTSFFEHIYGNAHNAYRSSGAHMVKKLITSFKRKLALMKHLAKCQVSLGQTDATFSIQTHRTQSTQDIYTGVMLQLKCSSLMLHRLLSLATTLAATQSDMKEMSAPLGDMAFNAVDTAGVDWRALSDELMRFSKKDADVPGTMSKKNLGSRVDIEYRKIVAYYRGAAGNGPLLGAGAFEGGMGGHSSTTAGTSMANDDTPVSTDQGNGGRRASTATRFGTGYHDNNSEYAQIMRLNQLLGSKLTPQTMRHFLEELETAFNSEGKSKEIPNLQMGLTETKAEWDMSEWRFQSSNLRELELSLMDNLVDRNILWAKKKATYVSSRYQNRKTLQFSNVKEQSVNRFSRASRMLLGGHLQSTDPRMTISPSHHGGGLGRMSMGGGHGGDHHGGHRGPGNRDSVLRQSFSARHLPGTGQHVVSSAGHLLGLGDSYGYFANVPQQPTHGHNSREQAMTAGNKKDLVGAGILIGSPGSKERAHHHRESTAPGSKRKLSVVRMSVTEDGSYKQVREQVKKDPFAPKYPTNWGETIDHITGEKVSLLGHHALEIGTAGSPSGHGQQPGHQHGQQAHQHDDNSKRRESVNVNPAYQIPNPIVEESEEDDDDFFGDGKKNRATIGRSTIGAVGGAGGGALRGGGRGSTCNATRPRGNRITHLTRASSSGQIGFENHGPSVHFQFAGKALPNTSRSSFSTNQIYATDQIDLQKIRKMKNPPIPTCAFKDSLRGASSVVSGGGEMAGTRNRTSRKDVQDIPEGELSDFHVFHLNLLNDALYYLMLRSRVLNTKIHYTERSTNLLPYNHFGSIKPQHVVEGAQAGIQQGVTGLGMSGPGLGKSAKASRPAFARAGTVGLPGPPKNALGRAGTGFDITTLATSIAAINPKAAGNVNDGNAGVTGTGDAGGNATNGNAVEKGELDFEPTRVSPGTNLDVGVVTYFDSVPHQNVQTTGAVRRPTFNNVGYTTDQIRNACSLNYMQMEEDLLFNPAKAAIRCANVLHPTPSVSRHFRSKYPQLSEKLKHCSHYLYESDTLEAVGIENAENHTNDRSMVTVFGNLTTLADWVKSDEKEALFKKTKAHAIQAGLSKVRG